MARRNQASFIEKFRSDLEARAAKLRPLVDELREIETALEALSSDGSTPRTARRNTPRTSARTTARPRAKRAPRSQRFVRIVRANPGITVSGVAKKMGVQAAGLYGVANGLVKEGKVKKKGTKLTVA
jgi:hypothetical protein